MRGNFRPHAAANSIVIYKTENQIHNFTLIKFNKEQEQLSWKIGMERDKTGTRNYIVRLLVPITTAMPSDKPYDI